MLALEGRDFWTPDELRAACRPQKSPALATVAVVGFGEAGLAIATAFGKRWPTVGYDMAQIDAPKERLRRKDPAGDAAQLAQADFIVIAVPMPPFLAHRVSTGLLEAATATVGQHMKPGAIVIHEATVYPGVTEEVCVPLLERHSGLRWRRDFHVGYVPARPHPAGDRLARLVSADDDATLDAVAALYASVVPARICRASAIRVAEAAQVIEDTQRDLDIALLDELAAISHQLGFDGGSVRPPVGTH